MTAITLPPLPEPDLINGIVRGYRGSEDGYGAAQVEQIRRDAVRAALGAAVEVCNTTPPHPFRPSIEAAHAIRALMPKDDAAERVAAAGGSGLPDLLAKFDGLPDVSGKVADVMPKEEGQCPTC